MIPVPWLLQESESADSRTSVNSLDGKPPELPFRPPLPRRNELYARSERSDKSEKSEKSDVSGELCLCVCVCGEWGG